MKPTIVLNSGTLKIIVLAEDSLSSNTQRARNGSDRFKPVWFVAEINDAGEVVATYRATDFSPRSISANYDPRGLRAVYPAAKLAIRASDWLSGFWLETSEELKLYG